MLLGLVRTRACPSLKCSQDILPATMALVCTGTTSYQLCASGNRWHSALGSIGPQVPGFFGYYFIFFCLTTKNLRERGMSENKAQRDALRDPDCFGTFAKVASPLCEFPSTQHKQSKPEAGGLFKLVSLLWHITNRQKPLSATSAGCDICWCLWL